MFYTKFNVCVLQFSQQFLLGWRHTCMEKIDNNLHNLSDTKLSSLQSRLDDLYPFSVSLLCYTMPFSVKSLRDWVTWYKKDECLWAKHIRYFCVTVCW